MIYAFLWYFKYTLKNYKTVNDFFCIPITFHNCITAYFLNKKYFVKIQTRSTQIVNSRYISYWKTFFNTIFKDNWCTKPITFWYSIKISIPNQKGYESIFRCFYHIILEVALGKKTLPGNHKSSLKFPQNMCAISFVYFRIW